MSVQDLVEAFSSDNPHTQIAAVLELIRLGANEALPAISKLAASPHPVVRATAAQALGTLGETDYEESGRTLMRLLNDSEVLVRSEALDALSDLKYQPAQESIRSALLSDADPLVRASAAEALGNMADASALQALLQGMRDEDETVRSYTAFALGLVGTPELLPELESLLQSETSLRVRAELLQARYRLGVLDDLPKILALLKNADEDLAVPILNCLQDLGTRRATYTSPSDVRQIQDALDSVVGRIPWLKGQADEIVTTWRRALEGQ